MACVAKYTDDGSWYRGKILNIKDSYLDILFVDYGNKQRTPINFVKAVEKELVALPPQAYHCSMSEVDSNWTSEDKIRFFDVTKTKFLAGTFARKRDGDQYSVRLVDVSGSVINDAFKSVVPSPEGTDFTTLPIFKRPIDVNVAFFYSFKRFFLSPTDISAHQVLLKLFKIINCTFIFLKIFLNRII